jgi:phosphoglycerate kinase
MKSLTDFNFENKRVLIREDFNVPLGNDNKVDAKEDLRLKASLPTIEYLLKQKARIVLLSHLGRPDGKVVESLRLDPIADRLEKLLGQKVVKLNDCCGKEVEEQVAKLQPKGIILLENLRFYKQEVENDPEFVQQLAKLGDFYINDAFGVAHRAHASVVGLPKYLPNAPGLLLKKEIKILSRALDDPKRPLVTIIGGAKISTKIKLIESFLEKADNLILGGALANTVISAKGIAIGKSVTEESMIEEVKKLELTNTKLNLPVDVVVSVDPTGKEDSRIAPVGNTNQDEMILDIGPDSNSLFERIISQAKTIIWNGPMGLFEVEKFASGSREVARAVAQSNGFSIVGGGDTINLLEQVDLSGEIDHISTGGGAMLKFLAGEKLPGIEALE